MRFQFSGPPQKRGFSCACVLCLPRLERPRQPEAWAPSPRARRAFSLRSPSARRRWGLRKSSDRTRGLFAGWEGVASLGLSLPLSPAPCLLPTAGMGQLFSGVSQSPCWWRFCEPPAVCSGRLIFPCSPAVLKNLPPTALRAFGPVPTLSNAAHSSPTCWWRVRASGVLFCCELLLGT